MNPFERLPGLPSLEEMVETALRRASKRAESIPYMGDRVRTALRREGVRIETLSTILSTYLKRGVKIGEAFTKAETFYRELGSLLTDGVKAEEAGKRLKGSIQVLERLKRIYKGRLRRRVGEKEAARIRREAYGRIISVVKRRRKEIEHLRNLWKVMRRLPSLDTGKPVVVVAGPPNVGKSSLVRAVSRARVEVASYPFTTKDIWLGHVKRGEITIQIMDTPGLMDRPMAERNLIERKAILCLQYAADVIVFLFDPSPIKYYPLEEQVKLYEEIKETFKDIPIIPVLNKVDVGAGELGRVEEMVGERVIGISALEGTGLETLLEEIIDRVPPSKKVVSI